MTFLQGAVPEIDFFTKIILPIAESMKGDGRVALEILKEYSPLLSKQNTEKPYELYLKCREKAVDVASMVNENKTIREIVKIISDSQLINLPNVVDRASNLVSDDVKESDDEELTAWVNTMDLPIEVIRKYDDYVNHRTRFDTHQGVKGLVFGVKNLSETDINNMAEGKETSINRTQRLFYVTCTRAKKSLAVVMYTNNPEKVKEEVIQKGWFKEEEIVTI